jgi:hypothetical protein
MCISDFDASCVALLIESSLDRMPSQIGDFISEHVYEGQLQSYSGHIIPSSAVACRFIDVNGSERLDKDGKSTLVSVVLALYIWGERWPTALRRMISRT